jgi:hypothetical protein
VSCHNGIPRVERQCSAGVRLHSVQEKTAQAGSVAWSCLTVTREWGEGEGGGEGNLSTCACSRCLS